MLRRFLATLAIAAVLVLWLPAARANDYDRDDSDYLPRYAAYVLHPVGVALEYTITRPIHWLVHRPGFGYIFGHEGGDERRPVADTGRTLPEESMAPASSVRPEESPDKNVEVTRTADGIHYTIVGDAVLFASGSADLTEPGKAILDNVAAAIQAKYAGRDLAVEGHTDAQPIKYSSWKSNWELGAARAMAMVHYLVGKGFDSKTISAVSYGENKAVAPNDTPENMAKNRRAVITVKTGDSPAGAAVPKIDPPKAEAPKVETPKAQ